MGKNKNTIFRKIFKFSFLSMLIVALISYVFSLKLTNSLVAKTAINPPRIFDLFKVLSLPFGLTVILIFALAYYFSLSFTKDIVAKLNLIDAKNSKSFEIYDEFKPFIKRIVDENSSNKAKLKKLNRKKNELKIITNNINEVFIVIDTKFNIVSYNDSALELFDYSKDENLEGNSIFGLNRSIDFVNAVERALDGKHGDCILNINNSYYQVFSNSIKKKNNIRGAVLIITDITERFLLDKLRKEFSANVSHELKTPLTSISGYAEIMKNGLVMPEDIEKFSSKIYDEAQRLSFLVNDIIRISNIDENAKYIQKEKVDLYEINEECISGLSHLAENKGVRLNNKSEHIIIEGSREMLYEMVHNLVSNAIKYNNEGGKVLVKLYKKKSTAILSVEDDGIGIPKEHLNRIFERFYRVDASRSRSLGGTGLGLSIVKHGAIFHKAALSVDSKKGKGSKFTLSFDI